MNAEEKLAKDMEAARAASAAMSERVTREYVRDYLISYRIVEEVDNRDNGCEHCQSRPVTCNVYAHIYRQGTGTDVEVFETCALCPLDVLDSQDVATEYMVIIERVNA